MEKKRERWRDEEKERWRERESEREREKNRERERERERGIRHRKGAGSAAGVIVSGPRPGPASPVHPPSRGGQAKPCAIHHGTIKQL